MNLTYRDWDALEALRDSNPESPDGWPWSKPGRIHQKAWEIAVETRRYEAAKGVEQDKQARRAMRLQENRQSWWKHHEERLARREKELRAEHPKDKAETEIKARLWNGESREDFLSSRVSISETKWRKGAAPLGTIHSREEA